MFLRLLGYESAIGIFSCVERSWKSSANYGFPIENITIQLFRPDLSRTMISLQLNDDFTIVYDGL